MTETDLFLILSKHMSSGKARLPAFDRTGLYITQEMAKAEPNLRNIKNLVLQDPALAVHVLRAANSVYYRGLQEVTSVKEAFVRLGLVEVASLVIVLSQKNAFMTKDTFIVEQMNDLWTHSVVCAQCSAWIANEIGMKRLAHEAFFAGLLHDIGKAFLLIAIGDLYQDGSLVDGITPSYFSKAVTDAHSAMGAKLLHLWDIPVIYSDVVRRHHDRFFAEEDKLLSVVSLANKMMEKNGIGTTKNPDLDIHGSLEVAILGLSQKQVVEMDLVVEHYLDFVHEVA